LLFAARALAIVEALHDDEAQHAHAEEDPPEQPDAQNCTG
jgi:hypothetical protein